jgi:transposase-like protein
MTAYSMADQADVSKRTSPPNRQSVAEISEKLGIELATLYKWRKAWRLQQEMVASSEKGSGGWRAADKFTLEQKSSQAKRHRGQLVLPRARPVPGTDEAMEAGGSRCQRQAGADEGRTEGP